MCLVNAEFLFDTPINPVPETVLFRRIVRKNTPLPD